MQFSPIGNRGLLFKERTSLLPKMSVLVDVLKKEEEEAVFYTEYLYHFD